MSETTGNEIAAHVPRMYRVAFRLLGDADAALDAVQDACVKALAGMAGFNGQAAFATWLHRITVNCAKDALRSQGRKDRAYGALLHHGSDRPGPPSPAEVLEAKELTELAWALVEQLPDECRSAFALTQLDGYSYDEAAEIEGEPRGTMASRVFRAKKILLEQMNSRMGGQIHD